MFVDLSTYDVDRSKRFYHALFGWQYEEDDEGYCVAYAHTRQVCGIYQTPQMFQDMNMPHFWMTYIQVDSRDETVRIAQAH